MNILFFAHNGKPYGANKSLFSAIRHLAKNHNVKLIVPFNNSLENQYKDAGIRYIVFPYYASLFFFRLKPKYLIYPFLVFSDLLVIIYLYFKLKKFKPDLIYSNCSVENIGFVLAKMLQIKHVTHVREFGDLDYQFKCIFGKSFKKYYLNQSDGLIFNSEIIQRSVLPVEDQNTICATIYNGIEVDGITSGRRILDKEAKIKIGIVGYIHSGKRQLESIQYLKKYLQNNCKYELHLFGSGEKNYLAKIIKYVKSNNLENNVFLHGFVSDISNIYINIDLLLVFAKHEAFGRVTIEAMQNGIPVIGYDGGGTPEIINHNIDGFLFSDEASFCESFEIITENESLYSEISEMSIQKIANKFSESKYIYNIENFVKQVFEKEK